MPDQRIDEDDKRPASRRVADELKALINAGTYPVDTALPPLRHIAEEYGVAVNTALAAARLLGTEGYVTSKPNGGYYVRDRSGQVDPERELRSLRNELGEVAARVRDTERTLSTIEDRLMSLSDSIARLENNLPQTGQRRG